MHCMSKRMTNSCEIKNLIYNLQLNKHCTVCRPKSFVKNWSFSCNVRICSGAAGADSTNLFKPVYHYFLTMFVEKKKMRYDFLFANLSTTTF